MARPRRNAIDRFNVATNLTNERKFLKFVAVSKLPQDRAYLTLVRLWEFTAINYALDGDISADDQRENPTLDPEDKYALAAFCWYEGDPDNLISSLQSAGFLDSDLTVHEWFTHQPLAEKLVRKRMAGSKGGQRTAETHTPTHDEFGKFSPKQNDRNPHSASGLGEVLPKPTTKYEVRSRNSEETTLTTGVVSVALHARAREAPTSPVQRTLSEIPKPNGRYPPDPKLEAMLDFTDRAELILGKLSENDRAGIRFDLSLHGSPTELDWILDQLQATKTDGRLNVADGQPGLANPVGWIRKQIQTEIKTRKKHT